MQDQFSDVDGTISVVDQMSGFRVTQSQWIPLQVPTGSDGTVPVYNEITASMVAITSTDSGLLDSSTSTIVQRAWSSSTSSPSYGFKTKNEMPVHIRRVDVHYGNS